MLETVLGINLHAAACASLPIFTMSKSTFPRTIPFPNKSDPMFVLGNNRTAGFPWRGGSLYGQTPHPVKSFYEVFLKKIFIPLKLEFWQIFGAPPLAGRSRKSEGITRYVMRGRKITARYRLSLIAVRIKPSHAGLKLMI